MYRNCMISVDCHSVCIIMISARVATLQLHHHVHRLRTEDSRSSEQRLQLSL